jgi:sugar lactone lactonase YvrE
VIDSVGNLYVSDWLNHTVRKIDPTGLVSTFAGTAGSTGYHDDLGTLALFNGPTALGIDKQDHVYVVEKDQHLIRKISPAGLVSTYLGQAGNPGMQDGPILTALISTPQGLAFDVDGNMYITDAGNQLIRKVDTLGEVTTFGGIQGRIDVAVGPLGVATFVTPNAITVDPSGRFFITDLYTNAIIKIE